MTVVTVAAAVAVGVAGRHQGAGDPEGTSPTLAADFSTSGPWDARLLTDGDELCNATIIAPRWMITTARCARHPSEIEFDLDSESQGASRTAVVSVDSVRTHPDADLALVRLDHDVPGPYAPLGTESPRAGGQVRTYGWSMSCEGDEALCATDLQTASSTRVTTENCGGTATICLARDEGCATENDFARPLFASGPGGAWYLIGLSGACHPTPAYTDVTRYRDWIRQNAGV
ncbi:trypsin-like serine protease [Amycolatopsis oliviviridis]|uniref:trypsin-like serine protease n=1 Tax=Amycolatopsis oliviviridis TaxID=1471590 RepID=UPI00174919A9|nr:trypsin-like serine protease [Amycolatopsis oliviviridis]